MIEINGLRYIELAGARFGPLRQGAYHAGVLVKESDFCACARGQHALRWHREGLTLLPALAADLSACQICQPGTGLIVWKGWYTDEGSCVNMDAFVAKPLALPKSSKFEVVLKWGERSMPVEPLMDTKIRVTLFNATRIAVPMDEPMEGGRWSGGEAPDEPG